jgi:uncharacterized protein YlxW (UPF0749 family)
MLLIFVRIKQTFLLFSFDLILNLAINKQKKPKQSKKMSEQRTSENEKTKKKNERTKNERTKSERKKNKKTIETNERNYKCMQF